MGRISVTEDLSFGVKLSSSSAVNPQAPQEGEGESDFGGGLS